MAIRTDAHDSDSSRKGVDCEANGHAPESTQERERGSVSGASREPLAPFAPYEREFRQVLAEMSLVQYGKTQSFNGSGGKGENPDPRPNGEAHPMHEFWTERWTLESVSGRGALLVDAREALRAWKVRTAPLVTDGSSEDDWIIEDGEGLSPDEAALRFKRTPAMVRRLRLARDRDSERGLAYDKPDVRVPDAEQRIRNLASQGCTERQIAFQVGVSKSTVRRALGRAA